MGTYISLSVEMWRASHSFPYFPIVLFPGSFYYPISSLFAPSIQMCLHAPPCLSVRPSILVSIRTLQSIAEGISINLLLTNVTAICQRGKISVKITIKQHNMTNYLHEAESFLRYSVNQYISRFYWKPEIYFRINNSPLLAPYPVPDQSSPCHFPTYWWFILIIFYHLRLGLSSGLSHSLFITKTLHDSRLSPASSTSFSCLILLDLITRQLHDTLHPQTQPTVTWHFTSANTTDSYMTLYIRKHITLKSVNILHSQHISH